MEDLIKTIHKEIANQYSNIDNLKMVVLFSNGHISCGILVNNKDVNHEIGFEKTLKIYEYIKNYTGDSNRFILSLKGNKITQNFNFDESYFISSNQGFLNLMNKKTKDNLVIEKQELIDLLSIVKFAITKVNLKKEISQECKLYLATESCQLITDISSNFILNKDKYLFLCNIAKEDIQHSNFDEIIYKKTTYQLS